MRKWYLYILLTVIWISLSACSIRKDDTKKLRDVEFTVVNPDEIPEELKVQIEAEKEEEFKLTYGDNGYLYIARGYGKRQTSGYSVEVAACYETEDLICMETELLGPPKEEEIQKQSTYPYVVIKIEYTDKNVAFN